MATTTVGTTLADYVDRSIGIGYTGGSALLFVLLMASLALWYRSLGSISVNTISTPKAEAFYWSTILFSQTLGTSLGDWMADSMAWATKVALWCLAPAWRSWQRYITRPGCRAPCYSGPRSSLSDRWALL